MGNKEDVKRLVDGSRKALKECKVKDENIFETEVPGSFELPMAAKFLALSGTVDAIIGAGGTKMSGMGFSSITSDNGEEGKEEKKEGKGPGFFLNISVWLEIQLIVMERLLKVEVIYHEKFKEKE